MWVEYNPNPCHKRVGDCTVRALAKLLEQSWEQTYIELCIYGFMNCDMPSGNAVWGQYLRDKGYIRQLITEPKGYTVADFADKFNEGEYLLALQNHVVAVMNGDYYDMWDSGEEEAIYFWMRKDEK
jgi:hypothetical protein